MSGPGTWVLVADRNLLPPEPCVICGRTDQRPLVQWFASTIDGSLTCAPCVAHTNEQLKEVSMRRQIMVLGPCYTATFRSLLPLVSQVFDRLMDHHTVDGHHVTARQVETVTQSVVTEQGADSLYEPVLAAVTSAINVMLGGAVEEADSGI